MTAKRHHHKIIATVAALVFPIFASQSNMPPYSNVSVTSKDFLAGFAAGFVCVMLVLGVFNSNSTFANPA